jgi:hypothetical protein
VKTRKMVPGPEEKVCCKCQLSSSLSEWNLFSCCMQFKVYGVLKLIFQFRSNKL